MQFLKRIFVPRQEEKKDFSAFFRTATDAEKIKLMSEVARKANADQRALMEKYQAHQKTT